MKRANVAMCIGAISVKKQASLGLRSHLLFDVFAARNVFYSIIDIYWWPRRWQFDKMTLEVEVKAEAQQAPYKYSA